MSFYSWRRIQFQTQHSWDWVWYLLVKDLQWISVLTLITASSKGFEKWNGRYSKVKDCLAMHAGSDPGLITNAWLRKLSDTRFTLPQILLFLCLREVIKEVYPNSCPASPLKNMWAGQTVLSLRERASLSCPFLFNKRSQGLILY